MRHVRTMDIRVVIQGNKCTVYRQRCESSPKKVGVHLGKSVNSARKIFLCPPCSKHSQILTLYKLVTFFCKLNQLAHCSRVSSYCCGITELAQCILPKHSCQDCPFHFGPQHMHNIMHRFCHLSSDACNRSPFYQSLCNTKCRHPTIFAVSAFCKFQDSIGAEKTKRILLPHCAAYIPGDISGQFLKSGVGGAMLGCEQHFSDLGWKKKQSR